MIPLLTFYGDDFTGSTDALEVLSRAGLSTRLFLSAETLFSSLSLSPSEVQSPVSLGLAGVSRSWTPAQMETDFPAIFTAMRKLKSPLFHVKICSTFDSSPEIGSIGKTIEMASEAFPGEFVPLIVGAPVLNRFVAFGNLFARSGPESEVFRLDRHPTMAHHPVTPMPEADLRKHLAQQTHLKIGAVDFTDLEQGEDAIEEKIRKLVLEECKIILFDTLNDLHLFEIGRVLWKRADPENPLLVVGSSGVEYALCEFWRKQGLLPQPPTFSALPVERLVVLSGSCSPVAARQIEKAVENGFAGVAIDSLALAKGEEKALLDAIAQGIAFLRAGKSVILHTAKGTTDPRYHETRAFLDSCTDPRLASQEFSRGTGKILSEIVAETGVGRLVVAGGDTSGYVAQALGIESLIVLAPFAPGSPLCRVVTGRPDSIGLEVLFKGGQVGGANLYAEIRAGTSCLPALRKRFSWEDDPILPGDSYSGDIAEEVRRQRDEE